MKIVQKAGSDHTFLLYQNGLMIRISNTDAAKFVPQAKWITDVQPQVWARLAEVNSWVRAALGQPADGGGVAEG